MTFLWGGGDGEEPAISLDLADIDLLLHLIDRYREEPADELSTWPTAEDVSRVGGWLVRWRRAQSKWEELEESEVFPCDPPF